MYCAILFLVSSFLRLFNDIIKFQKLQNFARSSRLQSQELVIGNKKRNDISNNSTNLFLWRKRKSYQSLINDQTETSIIPHGVL